MHTHMTKHLAWKTRLPTNQHRNRSNVDNIRIQGIRRIGAYNGCQYCDSLFYVLVYFFFRRKGIFVGKKGFFVGEKDVFLRERRVSNLDQGEGRVSE